MSVLKRGLNQSGGEGVTAPNVRLLVCYGTVKRTRASKPSLRRTMDKVMEERVGCEASRDGDTGRAPCAKRSQKAVRRLHFRPSNLTAGTRLRNLLTYLRVCGEERRGSSRLERPPKSDGLGRLALRVHPGL